MSQRNIRFTSPSCPLATMEEPKNNSPTDIFNGLSTPWSRKGLYYHHHRLHHLDLHFWQVLFHRPKKCQKLQFLGRPRIFLKSPQRTMRETRLNMPNISKEIKYYQSQFGRGCSVKDDFIYRDRSKDQETGRYQERYLRRITKGSRNSSYVFL